ncbi:MAG: hypothetical protein ACI9VS_002609 [Candidatus Binatia bacterium]|jgi:hypothetical protein
MSITADYNASPQSRTPHLEIGSFCMNISTSPWEFGVEIGGDVLFIVQHHGEPLPHTIFYTDFETKEYRTAHSAAVLK